MKRTHLNIALCIVVVAMTASCRNNKQQPTSQESAATESFYDSGAGQSQPQTQGGKAITQYEMPARLTDRPEQILRRESFTISYNKDTRTPNYVAWHLTKAHTYGRFQRSEEIFSEDPEAPAPRATDNDYNSRYDRGHMCPAADTKWNKEALRQSFLFTNVCPQNHGLNKYEWNDVEMLCRDWARQYGAVDIVCGPIYDSHVAPRYIGRNKVRVPDRFFKVVLCRQGKPKAIGFIYRNEGRKQPMQDAVCTVDEIERLTGINFFPQLDDDIENRIEATATLRDW